MEVPLILISHAHIILTSLPLTHRTCNYMQAGSFAHTKQTLVQLEASALGEIKKLGGNPQLEQIVLKLAELYKPEQTE